MTAAMVYCNLKLLSLPTLSKGFWLRLGRSGSPMGQTATELAIRRLRFSTRWLLLWLGFREFAANSVRKSDLIFSSARPINDACSEYSFNFCNSSLSRRVSSFSLQNVSFRLRTAAANLVRLSLPCMRESFGVSVATAIFCLHAGSSSPADCEPLRCDEGV